MRRSLSGSRKSKPASRAQWLKRVITWAAAAALLAYVFHIVSFEKTWAAVKEADPPSVFAVTLLYFGYGYVADTFATWATFRWFCKKLDLADVFLIRGATYLLAIVNYNLGQAGIVWVIGKRRGAGAAPATGTVLLTMGVMFVSLLLLAGIGSFVGDPADQRLFAMRWVTGGGLLAFVAYLVVIAIRPGFLANRNLFRPLFDAGVVGHLKAWLVRFPHVAGHLVFQWWILKLFHVDLPLSTAVTLIPVILVIAWLPITVQGLGTAQVAAMELLASYVDAPTVELQNARVVAFSLTLTTVFVGYCIITGLICLRLSAAARSVKDGEDSELGGSIA